MRPLSVFLLLSLAVFSAAHEVAEAGPRVGEPASYLPVDPLGVALAAFALVLLLVAVSLFFPKLLSKQVKQFLFLAIALPVLLVTLYLAGSTVYLNLASASGGPVHWHADFEIWLCGAQVRLPSPHFPSNKIGTETFHHHDDYRIHVEGLVMRENEVNLHHFFEVIGGSMTDEGIGVPLADGRFVAYNNGDRCPDGKPGTLKLYRKDWNTGEFVEEPALSEYVLQPHFNVPPGDYLKIVFE